MAADLLQVALGFLAEYGLAAVFVLLVLDGAMLMPVLPGEAVMIMAVSQYAHDLGDLAFLIGLTTVAGILGSVILYGIARIGGRPLIERHPRLFMMDRRRRESLEETFQKPLGQSLVMFLRVIPLTRIIVNIPAGLAKMGMGRFIAFSSIGMAAFHGGFLWLAYEYQQPGSGVAAQATQLQEAYATPAWQYLQAHEVVGILGALAIGSWISLRSSRRMLRYPDGAVSSILGWLAVRVLVLGSIGVGVAMQYDPTLVYDLALAGGLDVQAVAAEVGVAADRFLLYAVAVAGVLGLILLALEGRAKKARARAEARRELEEQLDEDPVPSAGEDQSGPDDSNMEFEDVSS